MILINGNNVTDLIILNLIEFLFKMMKLFKLSNELNEFYDMMYNLNSYKLILYNFFIYKK